MWQYTFEVLKNQQEMKDLPLTTLEFQCLKMILQNLIMNSTDSQGYPDLFLNSLFNNLRNLSLVEMLPRMVVGLHLIREELLLDIFCENDVNVLTEFLQFAMEAMNWPANWKQYYQLSFNTSSKPLNSDVKFTLPTDEPPSIMKSLYSITKNSKIPITRFITFSRLVNADASIDLLITPRCFKLLRLYELTHSYGYSDADILDILTELAITHLELETFPLGVLTPLKTTIRIIESKLSQITKDVDLSVLSRPDLEISVSNIKRIKYGKNPTSGLQRDNSKQRLLCNRIKAIRNINERPPNIYDIISDVVKDAMQSSGEDSNLFSTQKGTNGERNNNFDTAFTNIHADQLFPQDRRYYQILSLLDYNRTQRILFMPKEADYGILLQRKKVIISITSVRTCYAALGRSAILYASESPLSTQKWSHKELNLSFIFPDGTRMSPDEESIKDLVLMGQFHTGVNSGLSISRQTSNITGSWIVFNKPQELDAQHGGFLLGLGLNGHLKNLEEWHVYNYLSPKNTHVSVGLLLGMCASLKETMDLKLTKVLSVHIVALLPPGSSDLNINIGVQTVSLVGLGLLYQNSRHKRMSDLLLSQISSMVNVNDESQVNESYRIGAGIALGLINMNAYGKNRCDNSQSNSDEDLEDMDEEPLPIPDFSTAKDRVSTELIESLISIVTDVYDVEPSWIPEASHIGAVMALILIFLKSNNYGIASKLRPDMDLTRPQNGHPEMFLFREWSYHMIMWNSVNSNLSFLLDKIDKEKISNFDSDIVPIYFIIAGRALSVGIKYSSSGSFEVRDNLLLLIDRFIPFYQYPGKRAPDFRSIINSLTILVNILIISVSMVMCSTGDLEVLKRIRYLHETILGVNSDLYASRNADIEEETDRVCSEASRDLREPSDDTGSPDSNTANPGDSDYNSDDDDPVSGKNDLGEDEGTDFEYHIPKYISTNLALGFLFLGSGQYALNTSSVSTTAYLILSVLPLYMIDGPLEDCLKYFWSMSIESRCLVVKDSITGNVLDNVPVNIIQRSSNDGELLSREVISPCLLPDIRLIRKISVSSKDYFPLEIEFDEDIRPELYFNSGTVIYIKPRLNNDSANENEMFDNTKDLQSTLKRKINDLEDHPAVEAPRFASSLFERLNVGNETVIELETAFSNEGRPISISETLNQNMTFSDVNKGNVVDYELELWRNEHL